MKRHEIFLIKVKYWLTRELKKYKIDELGKTWKLPNKWIPIYLILERSEIY